MRIQHNIAAMNSYRNFNTQNSGLSKNLEKLSSGYKINRAGDDAAGLAISEKMRAQITGLDVAKKNSKDGISLVQTAEGALTEVHDMLNRMYALAEQSANGTYGLTEREKLQAEIDQLSNEIDRIADSTNFNGIGLLNGDLDTHTVTVEGEEVANVNSELMTIGAKVKGSTLGASKMQFADAIGNQYKISLDATDAKLSSGKARALEIKFVDGSGNKYNLSLVTEKAAADVTVGSIAKALVALARGKSTDAKFQLSAKDSDQSLALEAFINTFGGTETATTSTGVLRLNVVASAAEFGALTSIRYYDATSAQAAVSGLAANGKTDGISTETTERISAGYELDLGAVSGNQIKKGDTFTVGSRTYEIAKSATATLDNKDATRIIVKGTAASDFSKNLEKVMKQLADDGYTTETRKNVNGTEVYLRFTNLDEVSEIQDGADISTITSRNEIAFKNNDAVKQEVDVTFGVASVTSSNGLTLSINWTDASGVAHTTDVKYTGNGSGSTNAANALKELKKNDEITDLFDVSRTGAKITFKAKTAGNTGVAQFTGIQVKDTATGKNAKSTTIGDVEERVEGEDSGKTLMIKEFQQGTPKQNFKAGDTVTVNGKVFEFVSQKSDDTQTEGAVKVVLAAATAVDAYNQSLKKLSEAMTAEGIVNKYVAAGSNGTDNGKASIKLYDLDNKNTSAASATETVEGGLILQIGDTADDFNKLTVTIQDMHSAKIFGFEKEGDKLNIVDASNATAQAMSQKVMDTVNAAIDRVSTVRGNLGAIQNRLEHTINNLSVTRENLQDAESTIRDTDIAEEMMAYTKNSILNQAAQAMLAQANQLPQGALQLLG